jgi:hypothetical protein
LVYFNKNNQSYDKSVDFTINCYDSGKSNVFSFSANCPDYGCKILENFDVAGKQIDYCDLIGKTEGKDFIIEKYAKTPVSDCQNITPFDITLCDETGCKYIKNGVLIKEAKSDEELRKQDPEFFIGRECKVAFNIQDAPSQEKSSQSVKKGFFKSILDLISCFFRKLVGKGC